MRRSEFTIKNHILESLILNGPLKLSHINSKANVNYGKLKKFLDNLTDNGLVVEKKTANEKIAYYITTKGLSAYRESYKLA